MKEEILDFIHYGLKTVDLANLNREHLINCFEELEKENADLEEKISVLLSCKNCPENKGGLICQKEYENKCLAQKIEFIKELQKENAELKEIIDNDVDKKIYVQLAKKAELADVQKDQLTKAKFLLEQLVDAFPKSYSDVVKDTLDEARKFVEE